MDSVVVLKVAAEWKVARVEMAAVAARMDSVGERQGP